ncbi:MAG: response regulator [Endomicrobium sp.]|jgi:CheY-like chemotaxis protein|nr:response regulator [Endomicrobium sp.]
MLNTKNTAADGKSNKKPDYEGKYILVAEDTEINREIIKAFLQNTKVRIDFAVNGIEAVNMFKENPDRYGLILMDVQMPKMDGLEATRKIRSLDFGKAKNIPIIALTANIFNEDIQECLNAGMNSHIGKPIDMDSMFVTFRKYMPESNDKAPHCNELDYLSLFPYINFKEGLERVMNDKELYLQLLGSFEGKKLLDMLIDNINNKDFKTAAFSAHTIKGIAASLGFSALKELSEEIESKAKLGQDLRCYIEKITKVINKTLDLTAELIKSQKS